MLRREFDRTGRRGPVGGWERVLCLPVAVAVHGRALAWQGHAESQGALGGAERRSAVVCLLSAATEVTTPQKTPARAGHRATDDRKRPSERVVLQTVGRGGEKRAKGTVSA